jgi:alpha-glucosidase
LIALRRDYPALTRGGMRVLHVSANQVVFCRESLDQRLLVMAARSPDRPVAIPEAVGAVNVYGDAADIGSDGLLPGDGPTFQVWQLPQSRPI